jgi:hypothetical protein
LALKEFMVQHVTQYKAGVFLELVPDWPALEKWDLNSAEGVAYLKEAFGDSLLTTTKAGSHLYASFRSSSERELETFSSFLAALEGTKPSKYTTKGGVQEGHRQ